MRVPEHLGQLADVGYRQAPAGACESHVELACIVADQLGSLVPLRAEHSAQPRTCGACP